MNIKKSDHVLFVLGDSDMDSVKKKSGSISDEGIIICLVIQVNSIWYTSKK